MERWLSTRLTSVLPLPTDHPFDDILERLREVEKQLGQARCAPTDALAVDRVHRLEFIAKCRRIAADGIDNPDDVPSRTCSGAPPTVVEI